MANREELNEIQVMYELEPVMGYLLNRHEKASKLWVPDHYVPWSRGRDYNYPWARTDEEKVEFNAEGMDWDEAQATYEFSKEVKSALIIAALTEDNLPSYHREIANLFGYDGAWRNWVNRWTAEEDRHGRAIHTMLAVSRTFDPTQLEADRMAQVGNGFTNDIPNREGELQDLTPLEGAAYVAMQELATVKAHENTGEHCKTAGDRIARELFKRVAKDEVLHWVVYRDLVEKAFELAPNRTMEAVARIIEGFQMPGAKSIPDFGRHAVNIAVAGIYDLKIQNNEVFRKNLYKHWDIENVPDLDARGEQALVRIDAAMETHDQAAKGFDEYVQTVREKREKRKEAANQ